MYPRHPHRPVHSICPVNSHPLQFPQQLSLNFKNLIERLQRMNRALGHKSAKVSQVPQAAKESGRSLSFCRPSAFSPQLNDPREETVAKVYRREIRVGCSSGTTSQESLLTGGSHKVKVLTSGGRCRPLGQFKVGLGEDPASLRQKRSKTTLTETGGTVTAPMPTTTTPSTSRFLQLQEGTR